MVKFNVDYNLLNGRQYGVFHFALLFDFEKAGGRAALIEPDDIHGGAAVDQFGMRKRRQIKIWIYRERRMKTPFSLRP